MRHIRNFIIGTGLAILLGSGCNSQHNKIQPIDKPKPAIKRINERVKDSKEDHTIYRNGIEVCSSRTGNVKRNVFYSQKGFTIIKAGQEEGKESFGKWCNHNYGSSGFSHGKSFTEYKVIKYVVDDNGNAKVYAQRMFGINNFRTDIELWDLDNDNHMEYIGTTNLARMNPVQSKICYSQFHGKNPTKKQLIDICKESKDCSVAKCDYDEEKAGEYLLESLKKELGFEDELKKWEASRKSESKKKG